MLGPEDFAELTTPSAPFMNGSIFLMARLLLRLRPIGLALRALLCKEGNVLHISLTSMYTASDSSARHPLVFENSCWSCTAAIDTWDLQLSSSPRGKHRRWVP